MAEVISRFTVTIGGDIVDRSDGELSLREAIDLAKRSAPIDDLAVITFASDIAGSLIMLDAVHLEIDADVQIILDGFTLDMTGSGDDARHFSVADNTSLTLDGGTLTGGRGYDGGSIQVDRGVLVVNGTTFLDNETLGDGGAIHNIDGTVTLTDAVFDGNFSELRGGAIYSKDGENALTIMNTIFDRNEAVSEGGGIYNDGTDIDIDGSYFIGNPVEGNGGAIYHTNGAMTVQSSAFYLNSAGNGGAIYSNTSLADNTDVTKIVNTTFANNTADVGGAIYNRDGQLTLNAVTISQNTAQEAGGVWSYGNTGTNTRVGSSIIAGNTSTDSAYGDDLGWNETDPDTNGIRVFSSAGSNIIGDGTLVAKMDGITPQSFVNGINDDIVGTTADQADAGLAALTITDTGVFFDLVEGSNAINAGRTTSTVLFDQRGDGFARKSESVDIGAIEKQNPAPEFSILFSERTYTETSMTPAVTTLSATDVIDSISDGLMFEFVDGENDNAKFEIDDETRQLKFKAATDFENPQDSDRNNTYLIQILVRDSDNFTSEVRDLGVTVVNRNEAIILETLPENQMVVENRLTALDLSNLALVDPDGDNPAVRMIISVMSGKVFANSTDAVEIDVIEDNRAIALEGSMSDIVAFMDDADAVRYISAAGAFGEDADKINISVSENFVGGRRSDRHDSITIDIAQDDTPIVINGGTSGNVTGGVGADRIITGTAETFVFAGAGDDIVLVVGDGSTAKGDDGDDIIGALAGDHDLAGGDGRDIIVGGLGKDVIDGGAGNDVIRGDASDFVGEADQITGGTGDDLLEGGVGADVFIFDVNDGRDTIGAVQIDFDNPAGSSVTGFDFISGVDQILLDAAFNYDDSDAAFAKVTDIAGTAVFADKGTSITFEGLTKSDLTADDFILA